MIDVTRDRVFLIYALMHNEIEINVGVVFLSAMKKENYHLGHRYGFSRLRTSFLRSQEVKNEALDYMPVVKTFLIDVTNTKRLDMANGTVLTILECLAQNNEITSHKYGQQIL
ncbi:hypothetical protein FXO37_06942 [Capsicum annuum]|nr:hypothetical protein FXO37_06942 [Capsicum annuum]